MGKSAPAAKARTRRATAGAEITSTNGSAVWERVRGRVEQQLTVVELQAHRLLDRALTEDEIADASAAAAALARGLGALRQDALAQLARHIEQTLGEPPLEAATGVLLAGTIEDLRTLLESTIAQQETATAAAGVVVAIGTPSAAFDAHLWVLASRGHRILHEADRLPDGCGDRVVAVIVAVGDHADVRTRALLKEAEETFRAPSLVLHDGADSGALQTLAHYCQSLLPISASPDTVSEEILHHLAANAARLGAVICGADHAVELFEAHGYDVTAVTEASELPVLVTDQSRAIVLGHDVSSKAVLDLARLIRATPTTRQTPILWEGTHGPVTSLTAERLGVMIGDKIDDCVAVRLASLLRHAAGGSETASSVTGALLSWPAAQVLIDRSLVAANRTDTTTSVATIDVATSVTPDELAVIADLLKREFRRGDVVGRRDDRRFVVALQGAPRRVAVDRMVTLAGRLAPDADAVRVGVAEFPSDGRSADELVFAADSAVERSADADGPQVVPTTWRPLGADAVDVLIVDPDPVLGELIAGILAAQGHRCEQLTDGTDALDRLTHSSSDALPRLLILDVDLGGVDGITLLRSLRPSGILAHMEILVVSARAAETDIRQALELGATDIIRKPFSTTLLLHRVGRLLEH